MRRLIVFVTVAATGWIGLATVTAPVEAKAPGANGRILFQRLVRDFTAGRVEVFKRYTYTANPDGSDVRSLTPSQLCSDLHREQCSAEAAQWSPDGEEVLVSADVCGLRNCAAFIVDPDTRVARTLPETDPAVGLHCFTWSPNGARLACLAINEESGGDPSLDGIYTIRSSDGGGITRITDFIGFPADYSPDGTRLVVQTFDENDMAHLSVVGLDGSGPTPITPPAFAVNPGIGVSWSPDGSKILFSGVFVDSGRRGGLWTVSPSGSGMQPVSVPGCGGPAGDPTSLGCLRPAWSPDGTKIVFDARGSAKRQVYTANADGSGLSQITSSGLWAMDADWGPHPVTA